MKLVMPAVLLFITTLFVTVSTCAQQKNYVGLNVTLENAGTSFRPKIGGLFERQLTKRSGIETGLYYRTYGQAGIFSYTDSSGSQIIPFTVSERYLSIPALYRFYSRIINFAAGPTFDFYMGWRQKNSSSGLKIDAYDIDPNLSLGFLAKISKRITLSKQFFLEPEVQINPMLASGRTYAGFGIAAKYGL